VSAEASRSAEIPVRRIEAGRATPLREHRSQGESRRLAGNPLLKPYALLWQHRRLLRRVTRQELRMRFAGSLLGALWLFIYPALLLGIYSVVFVFVLRIRFGIFSSPYQYIAFIFCGLIPYIGFADTLSTSVTSVVSNATLIKNTLFPIELVPVKSVLLSQAIQVPATLLLFVALGATGRLSYWTLLVLPVWIVQLIFGTGIAWILSSVNVFVRDLQSLVPIVITLLMFVSPISYPQSAIPPTLRPILALNPLYYLVVPYQDVLMLHVLPGPTITAVALTMSFGTLALGYVLFMRLKPVFTDVL
jgi:lipopolysaccharide transport system permease protein